mmetsp:Transcript_23550/g.56837  ORF Transcript_23550/g.56837 Transcript_23550/m.56837 type:complete len:81 (-) Transcript_23550:671-913(-)
MLHSLVSGRELCLWFPKQRMCPIIIVVVVAMLQPLPSPHDFVWDWATLRSSYKSPSASYSKNAIMTIPRGKEDEEEEARA